jgi:hypothetical protein
VRTSRASLRVKRCVDAAHAREAARKARKSLGTRGCFRAGACDAKFALASKTGRRGRLAPPAFSDRRMGDACERWVVNPEKNQVLRDRRAVEKN